MDFQNILKAVLMNQAAHTGGHMDMAYQMGMRPAYVDYKNLEEVVPRWVSSPRNDDERRKATAWHGAGFEGQQDLGKQLFGTETKQSYDRSQGLYKLAYALGVHPSSIEGDVESMERISGNKATKALLGASALSDIFGYYNPDRRWGLDFITPQGAPGLKFNWRF
jgi:hypothetical protein